MAAPTVQSVGTEVEGVGAINVAWPTHQADDIGILFVESANQTVSTPAGWTSIASAGTGTAGVASSTGVAAFWKRATSAAEAVAAVADTGARQIGVIMVVRGCIASGSPVDVFTGDTEASAVSLVSFPGVTTTVAETLVLLAMSNSLGIDAPTVRNSLVNANVTNLATRVNTQEPGVGGGDPTGAALPVGLSTFGSGGSFGDVGQGPGLDAADPRCTALLFVPNINDIGAQIDTADLYEITLVLNIAGNKGAYTSTVGGTPTLDMAKYEANVRKFRPDADNTAFADRVKFADAVRRNRVVFYVVDEPNLRYDPIDHPTVPNISPTAVNQMALIHKATWAGYGPITIVRCAANTLNSGWGGLSKPTGGYTGVDYCWIQYNNNHAKGGSASAWAVAEDPRDVWEEQMTVIATNNMNMGVCVSLNLWAGGIGVDTLGVTARWDVGNDGGPLNFLGGDRDANEATEISTLLGTQKSLAASPEWIEKVAELVAADPDIPLYLMWQHVTSSNPSSPFLSVYNRADYREALDNAILIGQTRTVSNGWRTPK